MGKILSEWLYKIVVCITVYDYVVRDIGLFISEKNIQISSKQIRRFECGGN